MDRLKVVQALRSISSHFDDDLGKEKEKEAMKTVPVDYTDRLTVATRDSESKDLANALGLDVFVLLDATQTDGVDFFNTTLDFSVNRYKRYTSRGLRIS